MADVTYLTDDDGTPLVLYKLEPREGVDMGTRNFRQYMAETGLGGTTIENDGTLVTGDGASVWDDVPGSLTAKTLSSVVGKVDYDWAENAITFQSGGSISTQNDCVVFSAQMPHAMKTDSTVDLHIHWEQTDTYANMPVQFTVKHRIQNNGQAKATSWTTTVVECNDTNNVFTYTSGTIIQITDLVEIDMTGASISAVIEFQIARTDSETGDVLGKFIDLHVEKDTLGSRTEYTK